MYTYQGLVKVICLQSALSSENTCTSQGQDVNIYHVNIVQ